MLSKDHIDARKVVPNVLEAVMRIPPSSPTNIIICGQYLAGVCDLIFLVRLLKTELR